MGSLADQLRQNATGQDSRLNQSKHNFRPSYLYTPKQAASLSIDDVFGLGQNGFAALRQVTPGLSQVEPTLFAEEAKHTDRALLNKEENENLDQQLGLCLALLGPSVLVRPCGQILEWLIRRFRIQELNVSALMALMLPYHETPQFAQMLQLISLDKVPSFAAFVPVKKTMQPMSRHTLVKAMAKNNDLLTFVVNLPVNYINTESTYQTLVSFWAATLVAYLDSRPSVTQQELSLFLPVLFVAVKARKFPDVQLAAYIVIASLTAKSLLMADAVATIIDLIALKPTAVPREYTTVTQASITTIVSICQRQEELSVFPQRAFSSLIARAGFFDVLKELHQSTDLTPFWRPFCKTLVEELYHPERTQNIESTCDTLLNLDSPPSAVLAKALFDRHVEDTAAEIESPALLVQTLSHLRQRYPESFNAAVREAAEADSAAVAKAVEAVMTSETGEVNGQGALDADENIRMLAFQQTLVDGSISQADTCAILKDRSPAITALLESHANVILAHIDPQEVVEICHAALQSDDLPRATLGHLCTFISQSFLKNHPEHETQVIIDLWPRLLWTKAGKRSTALVWTALAKSPLTNSDLKSCFESHGSPEAIGSQNRTLIEALSRVCATNQALQDHVVKEALSPQASTSADLALLVASASLASKQETGHRALLQLFEPQFTASLANIDSKAEFTSEALPPDAVLVSVSHKPKSPRTRARLLAHLLLRLISSIHTDKRLEWSWLDRKAASDQTEQAQDLGRVATATFSLAHTTEHSGLRFALFNALFTHVLQSDSLAFLASVWIEPVHLQSGVALMALRDANVLVESSTADQAPLLLQHLLPTILVPLSHDDRSLREAALQLLTNMHQAGKKASATATPYGQSSLYGARTAGHGLLGGNEASLAYKDYLNYLTALLRQKDSIILSGASLASVHASLAENAPEIKKPKKLQHSVAQFLATSADRASNASTLVACLQCIAPIRQSEGINLLLPLIQHILVEGGIEHLYPTADQQQQIVELIITCFEQSRSSCFEHPAAPPLLAMRSIISSETRSSTAAAYRSRILRLMETAFFNKFSMKARYAMLEYIILQGLSLDTPLDVAECLSQIKIDSLTLTLVLESVRAALEDDIKSVKRTKTSPESPANSIQEVPQAALTLLLERLSFNQLEIDANVFQAIFDLATVIAGDQTLVSSDLSFIKQRLVLALSHSLDALAAHDLTNLTNLRIAPLIDLLRTSPNPQTTQRILSLIAQLTAVVPDQVISNIIPVFTFMGTSVAQRDDGYAQKTLSKVIACTLPVLVSKTKQNAKTHQQLVADLGEVLKTITNLASHIPRYRRSSLFSEIVHALGPQDFLAPVVLMLLGENGHKAPDIPERLNTTAGLLATFSARDQLAALCQLASECQKISSAGASSSPPNQNRLLVTLMFLHQVSTDRSFVSSVDASRAQDATVYDQALQSVIKALVMMQGSVKSSKVSEESRSTIQQMSKSLSTPALAEVISWLIAQGSTSAVLGGFALLRQSLMANKGSQTEKRKTPMRPAIEDCLRQLVVIVKSHASKPVQPDIAESVETIQHIANRVTPPPEQLVTVVDQLIVASEACKADEPKRALLLGPMSALIKCLGPRLLSRAQHVTRIGRALCGLTNTTLQARGLDILHGILNHLGSFVASFAVDFVNVCMREDVVMKDQMASLRNTMARQIPLKTIVPAYNKAWQQATKKPSSALILLRLIRSSIDATESKLVLPEHKTVFQLLQQAWEYSGIREDEIHSATTSGFLALVMKLNESAFKPLLLRTVDWAFVDAETTSLSRQTQVFSIVAALLDTLKIVSLPYFSYLIEPLASLLDGFATSGDLDDEAKTLWSQALTTLQKALSLDKEGFWNEARIGKLIEPLAKQVQLPVQSSLLFKQHYRPTVCAFAHQAAAFEDALTDLNRKLLEQTRSEFEDATRAEALRTLAALWKEVRDPLMPLVPQTTPFIVEALEEPGDVEAAAREMVAAVEDCLGEETLAEYMT